MDEVRERGSRREASRLLLPRRSRLSRWGKVLAKRGGIAPQVGWCVPQKGVVATAVFCFLVASPLLYMFRIRSTQSSSCLREVCSCQEYCACVAQSGIEFGLLPHLGQDPLLASPSSCHP